jgi:hypothetical protein
VLFAARVLLSNPRWLAVLQRCIVKTLPLKHKLFRKLYKEHGIFLDTCKMHSFRRNGYGSRIISWATIGQEQDYQSFETMADCLKYPTKLVRGNFGRDREITIEIDFEKIAATNNAYTRSAFGSDGLGDSTNTAGG